MIKLYNSLTKKKEDFKPIRKERVGMYSCGPTVYWYATIGNMRTYVFSDLLRRTLEFNKLKVKQIMNVTDVGHLTSDADEGDDKMEVAAKKENKSAKEIADYYFSEFKRDLDKLNILKPSKFVKATNYIKEQINLIKSLEKKGFTYQTNDGIYFDTSKDKDYGKMAGLNLKGLEAGKRVLIKEKKNNTDFALWKFSEKNGVRQQEWKSPWGMGFPGWHIECSAMSIKCLGKHFDIHTGGEDHKLVHHPNEIAQSENATGKKFVNYWLHGAFLLDNSGKKVSKSKGGLYTVSDLEKLGFSPLVFRYLCLQTHYRKQMHFSLDSLDSSKNAYSKIRRKVIELKMQKHKGEDFTKEYYKNFLESINDDLNISKALKVFWDVLDDRDFDSKKKLKLLLNFDKVLALGIRDMRARTDIPEQIQELLELREFARANKNWVEADRVRNEIKELGFIVEDSPEGPILRRF